MSKSLGNFFTVRDLLNDGVPGEVIRFVFLSTHYRKPMDWTEKKRAEAEATLRKWRGLTKGVAPTIVDDDLGIAPTIVDAGGLATLADDLNTSGMITHLHELASSGDYAGLLAGARMMGLLSEDMGTWAEGVDLGAYEAMFDRVRAMAMETKDFADVDRLKTAMLDAGVKVQMSKEGVSLTADSGFDASKLEGLL